MKLCEFEESLDWWHDMYGLCSWCGLPEVDPVHDEP